MSSSTSSKPRPRWFAPSSIPPILLLTVVTSFAFNHALISTQRKQDLRTHRIRTALLQDTIEYNSRLLFHLNPPSTASPSWFSRRSPKANSAGQDEPEWIQEDREALLRRWKALGLDPVANNLLPSSPNDTTQNKGEGQAKEGGEERKVGPKEITWSEIFLGSRESRSSLTERWQKVTAGIRDSFTSPTTPSGQVQDTSKDDEKELEELSQLWSNLSKQS